MPIDNDMRERFDNLEARFERLEKKVDQLPTKADLAGFATKADLTVFKDEIIKHFGIYAEDLKESVKKAAQGYAATLDRIERDLRELNQKMDDKFLVHDEVLTNHVGVSSRLSKP